VYVARVELNGFVLIVAMLDMAFQQQGDGLKSPVGVRRYAHLMCGIQGQRTDVVQEQKGIYSLVAWEWQQASDGKFLG
jgi:hypothetical protein